MLRPVLNRTARLLALGFVFALLVSTAGETLAQNPSSRPSGPGGITVAPPIPGKLYKAPSFPYNGTCTCYFNGEALSPTSGTKDDCDEIKERAEQNPTLVGMVECTWKRL